MHSSRASGYAHTPHSKSSFLSKPQQAHLFSSFFVLLLTSLLLVQHLLHLVSIFSLLCGLLCLNLCPGKLKLSLSSQLLCLCNIGKLICFAFPLVLLGWPCSRFGLAWLGTCATEF